MKHLTLVLALILTIPARSLHAQAPAAVTAPQLPPGPLIQKRAPDFSEWSITQKAGANPKSDANSSGTAPGTTPGGTAGAAGTDPNAIITRRVFTKTGKILNLQYTDEFGKNWNVWMEGNQRVLAWPDGQSVSFVVPPQPHEPASVFYLDLANGDFDGFSWISADNYHGLSVVNGKNCLVFSDTKGNAAGFPVSVSAAIDLKTRLPVSLTDGDGQFTYEFKTVSDTLTLPANVQKLVVSQQQKEARLKIVPRPAF